MILNPCANPVKSLTSLITRSGGGGAVAWTPLSFSGQVAWFEADQNVENISGAAASWTDSFGNGHVLTQASAISRPSLSNQVNGHQTLTFDGAIDFFALPSALLSVPNGTHTILCIFKADTPGNATQNLLIGYNAGSGKRWGIYQTATQLQYQSRSASNSTTNYSVARDTDIHVVGYRRNGTAIRPFYDNVEISAGSNAENFTATTAYVGGNGVTERFKGQLMTMLFLSTEPTDQELFDFGVWAQAKWGAPAIYRNINTLSTYDLNYAANTYKGGTVGFANNTNDGRLYRQYSGYSNGSVYAPNVDGTYIAGVNSCLRRSTRGLWIEKDTTNLARWCRDLTNAVWVKSNITATKDQTGADGTANGATRLTATSNNGTVLQAVTFAASDQIGSVLIRRITGVGAVEMTIDNGATWTAVTVAGSYTRVSVPYQNLTNPVIGLRMATSGDEIAVDFVMLEARQYINESVVATTTASVRTFGDRAACYVDDNNQLGELFQSAMGFYMELTVNSPLQTGPLVCDATAATGGKQVRINTDGSVTFNGATTPAGVYTRGISQKIAGYVSTAGVSAICVNGGTVYTSTSVVACPTLDHCDLGCNGSGGLTIHGVIARQAMMGPDVLSDADLIKMTT